MPQGEPLQDYEYRGLIASSWDLLRGDTSQWPDRAFYRQVILTGGEPALDVGCGTGRLLIDYVSEGLDVDGVDASPEMLAICREKAKSLGLRLAIYQQLMQVLDLPRKYRTVIVPSSSFQLLTDLREASAALQRFCVHLVPGGRLVMPFMVFSPTSGAATYDWKLHSRATRPEDGAEVRRYHRATYDADNQLVSTEARYEVVMDGRVVASELHRRSPEIRWYSQDQALSLMRTAGFEDVHACQGFTFEPALRSDAVFTVFGTRP
jgi:ubiquinone/menaquinone biosynthesis C-methylase UbiE